jgi:hypothetical protein
MTLPRDLHKEKQLGQRISTQCGIQSDANDEQAENTPDSIRQSFDGARKVTL